MGDIHVFKLQKLSKFMDLTQFLSDDNRTF